MKKLFTSQSAIGAIALLAWSLLGTVSVSQAAKTVTFISTDEPGPWFKCDETTGSGPSIGCIDAGSKSLAIIHPGDAVKIDNGTGTNNNGINTTNTVHTFTSLLWPLKANGNNADHMPFDQHMAFRGDGGLPPLILNTPGLYVFVCKLHPFMLAATIVDDPATTNGFDLGEQIRLINGITVPTSSDLATRLLRAFFLITNPENYQNYNIATNPKRTWHITYPGVPVRITGGGAVNLQEELIRRYGNDSTLPALFNPTKPGVGEVWIDTEYEKTKHKTKPGTATAVDTSTWKVTKKVALPDINMNNPHNMWTDRNQTVIYQTQWFSDELTVFNRITGRLIRNIHVGDAPAHVMTRVDNDKVHVSLNGADAVVEYNPFLAGSFRRPFFTQYAGQDPAQPHAHWMSFDGQTMVTPNSNTGDSTRIDIPTGSIEAKTLTGTLPIATGMMPDASKYYVSNYLDSTITCISIVTDACKGVANPGDQTKKIHLLLAGVDKDLANYDPINVTVKGMSQSGALPIQTPVSPDGKFVVTANTLSGTITIINTATDELVAVLPCSAGCHGVNFGAKKHGGYYAYVSSKFSNDLIIVDYDPNKNGDISDAMIAGRVVLVARAGTKSDDKVTEYAGMGGQGVLPIPLVYNGWVQNLPRFWKFQLTKDQRHPFPETEHEHD